MGRSRRRTGWRSEVHAGATAKQQQDEGGSATNHATSGQGCGVHDKAIVRGNPIDGDPVQPCMQVNRVTKDFTSIRPRVC